jgi:hypothetical protein
MLAKGIGANLTGTRADVIICDDVEVPNTCDTAGKRSDLRERLQELSFILTPDGMMVYIGTPHSYYTIYADQARTEIGEQKPFLDHYARLMLPVLTDHGTSQWPERFSDRAIVHIRNTAGPARFDSQMMLRPRNILQARLDPDLLQFYDEELDYAREINTLFIGAQKMTGASAWWDPAFGKTNGDRSVLAIVFSDAQGRLYLHRMVYIPPASDDKTDSDEATRQCEIIARHARDVFLPALTIETNGIGKFLPGLLRNTLARARIPCAVVEHHSRENKTQRILSVFDVLLASRRLCVHRSIVQTPFVQEMQEWQPVNGNGHDDGLDAAAGALNQIPMRINRIYGSGGHTWMQHRQTITAKTEFET